MSGNDCFGCPSRIYVRLSTDARLTFGPAVLYSETYSAELANMIVGVNGVAVTGPETSGNFYTGNVLYASQFGGAEIVPPADFASTGPSAGQSQCIAFGGATPGYETVLYTNDGGAGSDSAEVYLLGSPGPPGGVNPVAAASSPGFRTIPNPFSRGLRLELTGARTDATAPVSARVYDAAGRLVRVIADGLPASSALEWDGTSASGEEVPAGVYFVRLRQGDAAPSARRVVRVR